MSEFFRFPHTPHLLWLGQGTPRADKVLDQVEAERLLACEVTVEEKIDGANLGFSTGDSGGLRVQNRGSYIDRETSHSQFRPLWTWLAQHESTLADALWPDLMIFGEWCAAVHSVEYDALPDWFVGFDVYDRKIHEFWGTERRDALLDDLRLFPVPKLGQGCFSLSELESLLGKSAFGQHPMEGLIVRRQAEGRTLARAKLVRSGFTQGIEAHWSRRPHRRNSRAGMGQDPMGGRRL